MIRRSTDRLLSSTWSKFSSLFSPSSSKDSRHREHRQLRIESCEQRTLLAVLTGTKFEDIQGDGFTPDDTGLGGVTIQVYQDDGDGVFDPAVDLLYDAQVTSSVAGSEGEYATADLPEGKYFVRELAPAGSAQTAGPAFYEVDVAPSRVLDSFDGPVEQWTIDMIDANPVLIQTPSGIGGELDLLVDVQGEPGLFTAAGTLGGGTLESLNGDDPPTVVTLQYDGVDADVAPALTNSQGLNLDLTNGGLDDILQFNFSMMQATGGLPFSVILTSGADTATSGGTLDDGVLEATVPLAGFGAIDLENIDSIEIVFNGGGTPVEGGFDLTVDSISTTFDVDPTPYNFGNVSVPTPEVRVEKLTNTVDVAPVAPPLVAPTGPLVEVGDAVEWTYTVTNPGDVPLRLTSLTDDQGVTINPVDLDTNGIIDGDTDADGLLDTNETWVFTATGVAAIGQYTNIAEVIATPVDTFGDPILDVGGVQLPDVTNDDPSYYFGVNPEIEIVKNTNGADWGAAPGLLVAPDDAVTWTYAVTNAGNVILDITTIPLTDNPLLPGGDPADDTDAFNPTYLSGDTLVVNQLLDPGETWIFSAADNAVIGQYENTATVTGDPVDDVGDPLTQVAVDGTVIPVDNVVDTDTNYYYGVDSEIEIVKYTNTFDAGLPTDTGPYVSVGGAITWTYTVTNLGNSPLNTISITDDSGTVDLTDDFAPTFLGVDEDGDGILDAAIDDNNLLDPADPGLGTPAEVWFYSATALATEGQYGNTATVESTDDLNNTVTDTDMSHYFGFVAEVHLEKLTNGADADNLDPLDPSDDPVELTSGEAVTWMYEITNLGNVPLGIIDVIDDQGVVPLPVDSDNDGFNDGDTNENNLLDPADPNIPGDTGETWLRTASGIAIAGPYTNIGEVQARGPNGNTVVDTDPSSYIGVYSGINIEKYTNTDDADTGTGPLAHVGDTVTFDYIVTNPRLSALSNVTVIDDSGTPADISDDFSPAYVEGDEDNDGLLDLEETWVYQATRVVTAGQYVNEATATGLDDQLIPVQVDDMDRSHHFGVVPEIDIQKSTNTEDADNPTGPLVAPGSAVSWEYVVTIPGNLGNVALSNVAVADDQGVTVTMVDLDNDTIIDGDTNFDGWLDLGERWVYTATGIAAGTAEDGQYANLGTVEAVGPLGTQVADDDPSHYFAVIPGVQIEKSTNGEDADDPVDPNDPLLADVPLIAVNGQVDWEYVVTNTGNVPLAGVVVTDNQGVVVTMVDLDDDTIIDGDTDLDGLLDVDETWVYTATGIATAGAYANLGRVTGDPVDENGDVIPGFENAAETDTDPSHYFGIVSDVAIEKSTNTEDADDPVDPNDPLLADVPLIAVGGLVTWEYIVTNEGNSPLSNIVISDDNGTPGDPTDDFDSLDGFSPTFLGVDTDGDGVVDIAVDANGLLDVGEAWIYTATGTAAAGSYANVGTVTADDALEAPVTHTDESHYFGIESEVHIEKYTLGDNADLATGPLVAVGDQVIWRYEVTNTGNSPLENVEIVDDNGGPLGVDFEPTFLGVDVDGDGNIDDVVDANGRLDLNETWIYEEATGIAAAGQYENLVTVDATDLVGGTTQDDDPSHYFGVDPVINVEKFTDSVDVDPTDPTDTGPLVHVGDMVTFDYVVTNPGNVPLADVTITDDNGALLIDIIPVYVEGDENNDSLLDVGETWLYQATKVATADQYENIVTVTGTPPLLYFQVPGDEVPIDDTDLSRHFGVVSEIVIEKSTNGIDADDPDGPVVPLGSDVTWTYDVTNTGNVSLAGIVVTDDNGSPNNPNDDFSPNFVGVDVNGDGIIDVTTDDNGLLDPNETWRYSFVGVGAATAGVYGNLGTVVGTPVDALGGNIPGFVDVTDDDPSHYFGADPGLYLKKYTDTIDAPLVGDTGPLVHVGDTVTFDYVLTNAFNVPLSNVVMADDDPNVTPEMVDGNSDGFNDGDTNTDNLLDPGETWLYQATTIATPGQYQNLATVTALDPFLLPLTDTDLSHHFGVVSEIVIEKYTNGDNADYTDGPTLTPGNAVTWTYVVTNPGNVSLAGVTVSDDAGTPGIPGDDFSPDFDGVDVNGDGVIDVTTDVNGLLDPNETWFYSANGVATEGQYGNLGLATGSPVDSLGAGIPGFASATDDDPSHYFGYTFTTGISLNKMTNGQDTTALTAPYISVGDMVTFTYVVFNTGTVPLGNVSLHDDAGTGDLTVGGFDPTLIGGDDGDGILQVGEVWIYAASRPVSLHAYENEAVVSSDPLDDLGNVIIGAGPVLDSDLGHYFGANIEIDVEKYTENDQADTETGPILPEGFDVDWLYTVQNTGNVAITGILLTDSDPAVNLGIINQADGNDILEPGETWIYSAQGTAIAGQYENEARVEGIPIDDQGQPVFTECTVEDTDLSHYFGSVSGIDIEKSTNGFDADDPTGPIVPFGSVVEWTYVVRNTGNVPLAGLNATDLVPTDNQGIVPVYQSGNTDGDNLLDTDEVWIFVASGIVSPEQYDEHGQYDGQYANRADVVAQPVDEFGNILPLCGTVDDFDLSHHYGATTGIEVVKLTNDLEANVKPGPTLYDGDPVTWTYEVTNLGNLDLDSVVLTDDQGVIPVYQSGDNGDELLNPGETWIYEASGIVTVGQYANRADVIGTPVDNSGLPIPGFNPVVDDNMSHYYGEELSTISGYVYIDVDNDGVRDPSEQPIPGVWVYLYQKDPLSGVYNYVEPVMTNPDGYYEFTDLRPGTYKVREALTPDYIDGLDTIGSAGGTTSDNTFEEIILGPGESSFVNNFGERGLRAGLIGKYPYIMPFVETVEIPGTPGNDVIEVTTRSLDQSWAVTVNGVPVPIESPMVATLVIDGMGGNDTLRIISDDADDTLDMGPTFGTWTSGPFTMTFSNFEDVDAEGGGGLDIAFLHDSAGDDRLETSPLAAVLTGEGFSLGTEGYEYVHTYADSGGTDTAVMHGSAGTDKFKAYPKYGMLRGAGYYRRAKYFEEVYADASAGGQDTALFYDSPGNDYLTASRDATSIITDTGLTRYAADFDRVIAYCKSGFDQAEISDTSGNDIFRGLRHKSHMYGKDYDIIARGFDKVLATASSGYDKARLFDGVGDDLFTGTPGQSSISGSDIDIVANGFDKVNAASVNGGNDLAELYDTAGNDVVEADGNRVSLLNNDDALEMLYDTLAFAKVNVFGSTGTDSANIDPDSSAVMDLFGKWIE